MNNAPDYENNLAFSPKDTNYDILKEYEAHGEPLPSYEKYMRLKQDIEIVSQKLLSIKAELTDWYAKNFGENND